MQRNKWLKTVAWSFAVGSALALAACGGEDNEVEFDPNDNIAPAPLVFDGIVPEHWVMPDYPGVPVPSDGGDSDSGNTSNNAGESESGDGEVLRYGVPVEKWAKIGITSSSFSQGGSIPKKYICTKNGGQNVSPGLRFSGIPAGTKSLAIVMEKDNCERNDTTQATGCVHWNVWGIPSDRGAIAENDGLDDVLVGFNGSGEGAKGYAGPCPTTSGEHKYTVWVYALGEKRREMLNYPAMHGDIEYQFLGVILGRGSYSGTVTK